MKNIALIIVGAAQHKISSDLSEYNLVLTLDPTFSKNSFNFHGSDELIERAIKELIKKPYMLKIIDVSDGKFTKETQEIHDKIAQFQISGPLMIKTAMGMACQTILNYKKIVKSQGIKSLKGILNGKTVVTVAAGPSLEKDVLLLSKCKNKMVIFAAAQALSTLLDHSVKPDFVFSIDWTGNNINHFKSLIDVPLIASTATNNKCLNMWPGPTFLISSLFDYNETKHEKTIFKHANDKGTVPQAGSVAHAMISVAEYMKCKTIIMVGQDCALGQNGFTHCRKSIGAQKWWINEQSGKLQYQMLNPEYKYADLSELDFFGKQQQDQTPIEVEGKNGEVLFASSSMMSWKLSLEGIIKNISSQVINASSSGVNVIGAANLELDAIIDLYEVPFTLTLPFQDNSKCHIVENLKRDKKKIKRIINISNEIIKVNNQLMHLEKIRSSKFLSIIKKNKSKSKQLKNLCLKMPFMKSVLIHAILKSENVKSTSEDVENKKFMDSITRNKFYANFILKSAKLLDKYYSIAIANHDSQE